ncbi:MAG: 50S ribosomal protein L15 [Phycisphaerae bacterium]|nr:50S ribosomal protein L15 [Phycisphaerae bacterium]
MDIAAVTKLAGRNKRRKRVGRGTGSGHGKTCGRGHKGCGARAGGGTRPLTEGGQMPLFRRLPKRGFNNANFRTDVSVVNVGQLSERFDDGAHVTKVLLKQAGLIRDAGSVVKVLGDGELGKKLNVEADRFSKSAQEKIVAAGGTATLISK